MALCTQADVEKKLQWDITAEPDAVVSSLIADAQAMMESEVGRTLESANRTETFDGGFPWSIFLTYWPVSAMTTVTEDGTALTPNTDFLWYTRGKLIRISGGYQIKWGTCKPQSIAVAYVGGYLPGTKEFEHLGSICAEVVARAFRKGADNAAIPSGAGQIQSVTLEGSDSVTYATATDSATGGGLNQFIYLEEDERRQLALPTFRRPRFGFA